MRRFAKFVGFNPGWRDCKNVVVVGTHNCKLLKTYDRTLFRANVNVGLVEGVVKRHFMLEGFARDSKLKKKFCFIHCPIQFFRKVFRVYMSPFHIVRDAF